MNFITGPLGTDVSFYQDNNTTPQKINFATMKAAGAKFTIIRSGQNTWRDEDYADNAANAKAAGMPFGAYWFFDSRSSPASQANLWHSIMGTSAPKNLFIDLEESYGGAYQGEKNWKVFITAVETNYPNNRISIYTANWWWIRQLKMMGKDVPLIPTLDLVADPAYFAKYPLWVAGYTTNPADVVLPAPWRNKQAHIWQFSSSGDGKKYGAESSRIDLNYWNNTFNFDEFWGASTTPPPPPPADKKITITIKIDPPGTTPVEVVYE